MKKQIIALALLLIISLIILNPANVVGEVKQKITSWFSGTKELASDVKEMAKQAVNVHTLSMLSAAEAGDHKKVKSLLALGADVDGTDPYGNGNNALMAASGNGDYQMVTILLEAGANVNAANDDGYTSLMKATRNGYPKIVSTLLQAGANANAVDEHNFTALDHALQMQKGNPEKDEYNLIVELLKRHTTPNI